MVARAESIHLKSMKVGVEEWPGLFRSALCLVLVYAEDLSSLVTLLFSAFSLRASIISFFRSGMCTFIFFMFSSHSLRRFSTFVILDSKYGC